MWKYEKFPWDQITRGREMGLVESESGWLTCLVLNRIAEHSSSSRWRNSISSRFTSLLLVIFIFIQSIIVMLWRLALIKIWTHIPKWSGKSQENWIFLSSDALSNPNRMIIWHFLSQAHNHFSCVNYSFRSMWTRWKRRQREAFYPSINAAACLLTRCLLVISIVITSLEKCARPFECKTIHRIFRLSREALKNPPGFPSLRTRAPT